MLILIGVLLLSLIIPLAIYFFLRNAHPDDPLYKKDCRKLLLKGMLLCVPVFVFSLLCDIAFRLTHISDSVPFLEIVFKAFILMAFSEELMKYLLARGTIRRNRKTVSFLDVIAYTTIAAIGFELMEAFVYFFSTNIPQILVRGITSMHASFGLIMGFFLARGIRKTGKINLFPAVLIPVLIHGTYDLLLDSSIVETDWAMLALLLAALCPVLNLCSVFLIRKARKDPRYTSPLFPDAEEALEESESESEESALEESASKNHSI